MIETQLVACAALGRNRKRSHCARMSCFEIYTIHKLLHRSTLKNAVKFDREGLQIYSTTGGTQYLENHSQTASAFRFKSCTVLPVVPRQGLQLSPTLDIPSGRNSMLLEARGEICRTRARVQRFLFCSSQFWEQSVVAEVNEAASNDLLPSLHNTFRK